MICSKCLENIEGIEYFMVAVETPYRNVFFHKECYNELLKEVEDWEGVRLYLAENLNTWYNLEENNGKKRRNRRK